MKDIIIKNFSDLDIKEYPIAEAFLDAEGNTTIDHNTGEYKTTGQTKVWSIKAGETLAFPNYVGRYLLGVFGSSPEARFLEEVKDANIKVEEEADSETYEGPWECKFCDFKSPNARGLGMHMGSKHPEMLTK